MSWYKTPTTLAAVDSAFAHHTLVAYKQIFCSGSFIGSRIVLTVASCFQQAKPPYDIFVKFGIINFTQQGHLLRVLEKIEHEYFQYKSQLDNDIALLVLEDVSQSQANYLLQSEMIVINPMECAFTYPGVLTASIFCAKFELANLLSDNGGAALYNGLVAGVLSYGANIEDAPHIALFTNVTYFYKWIKLNTERLLTKHCSAEAGVSAILGVF